MSEWDWYYNLLFKLGCGGLAILGLLLLAMGILLGYHLAK